MAALIIELALLEAPDWHLQNQDGRLHGVLVSFFRKGCLWQPASARTTLPRMTDGIVRRDALFASPGSILLLPLPSRVCGAFLAFVTFSAALFYQMCLSSCFPIDLFAPPHFQQELSPKVASVLERFRVERPIYHQLAPPFHAGHADVRSQRVPL